MSELDLYDYHLPDELIAREPAARREEARLLVLHRESGRIGGKDRNLSSDRLARLS